MKSFQVLNVIPPDGHKDFTELQILKSAAGWYIGTIHTDPDDGSQEPGSRDSNYFDTKEDADMALKELWKVETELGYLLLENRLSEWGDRCSRLLGYDVYYRLEP